MKNPGPFPSSRYPRETQMDHLFSIHGTLNLNAWPFGAASAAIDSNTEVSTVALLHREHPHELLECFTSLQAANHRSSEPRNDPTRLAPATRARPMARSFDTILRRTYSQLPSPVAVCPPMRVARVQAYRDAQQVRAARYHTPRRCLSIECIAVAAYGTVVSSRTSRTGDR